MVQFYDNDRLVFIQPFLSMYYLKIIYEYNTAINNITAMIVQIVFNTFSIFILYWFYKYLLLLFHFILANLSGGVLLSYISWLCS